MVTSIAEEEGPQESVKLIADRPGSAFAATSRFSTRLVAVGTRAVVEVSV